MGVKSLFVKILKIFTSGLSFALIQEKLTELETDSLKKKKLASSMYLYTICIFRHCVVAHHIFAGTEPW